MLTKLKIAQFRCFEEHELSLGPGINLIVGPNARGKTSLLEAACVLLRLQSPRYSRLGELVRHGQRGLLADGFFNGAHLQFYYSTQRKKLALDSVEQRTATEYLRQARVVWFSNTDVQIIRDGGETRRRFLDFVALQVEPLYRSSLRDYERAVRSRKHTDLAADILEGHESAALCHIANISYRTGQAATADEVYKQLAGFSVNDDLAAGFEGTREYLAGAGVDLGREKITLGARLELDGEKEAFVANPAANALLTRAYRAPFVVPGQPVG
jgi:hypothetical protein